MRIEVRYYLAADNAVKLAEEARNKAFRNAYPRGCEVEWMHGEYLQVGEVLEHGYSDRLRARNKHTGRMVWVDGYSIRITNK